MSQWLSWGWRLLGMSSGFTLMSLKVLWFPWKSTAPLIYTQVFYKRESHSSSEWPWFPCVPSTFIAGLTAHMNFSWGIFNTYLRKYWEIHWLSEELCPPGAHHVLILSIKGQHLEGLALFFICTWACASWSYQGGPFFSVRYIFILL